MPSGYLHLRCAALSAERTSVANTDAYALGALGPDPLFTLGVFPLRARSAPGPHGKMLHTTRTGRFLQTLCALAARRGDMEKAYAMGFLTHYALDSTVHPYVYAHSLDKNGAYSSAMHLRLEKSWDALYFRRAGEKGAPVSMPGVAEARACWRAIATLLADAMRAVYPETSLPAEQFLQAFRGAEALNRLTRSRLAYGAACLLEKVLRKPLPLTAQFAPRTPMKGDIENTGRLAWRSLSEPNRARDEGLAELFAAAVERARELLSAASSFFEGAISEDSLAGVIGNAGYDTGMDSLP